MPVVSSDLIEAAQTFKDASGEGRVYAMLVTCPIGANVMDETGVPDIGSVFGGTDLKVDRIEAPKFINRNTADGVDLYEVRAVYSTDGRFQFPQRPPEPTVSTTDWAITYRSEILQVPGFRRVVRLHEAPDPANPPVQVNDYVPEPYPYPIDFPIFERIVYVENSVFAGYGAFAIINAQVGRIHEFGGMKWKMLPPAMARYSAGMVEIRYAWLHDPGTPPIGDPDLTNFNYLLPTEARPPFHSYQVDPPATVGALPLIVIFNPYPETSPFYVPDGWENLPGDPIS